MAYKVVLIDDNVNTVNSLRLTVDWEGLGYEVAGVAYDGEPGARLIERVRPDVVITDIQMPGVNGLTMIEQMQDYLVNARVIVVTGYDNFQYATQAIRLSVMDYVLKPIDNEELAQTLVRAARSLDQDRQREERLKQMDLFHRRAQLLTILTSYGSQVEQGSFGRFLTGPVKQYVMIVGRSRSIISRPALERLDFEEYPDNLELVSVVADGDLVIFVGMKEESRTWKLAAQTVVNKIRDHIPEMVIAVSAVHTREEDIKLAQQEARRTVLEFSVLEKNSRIGFYEPDTGQRLGNRARLAGMEELCARLAARFDEMSVEETWEIISRSYEGNLRLLRVLLMMYCTSLMHDKLPENQWSEDVDNLVFELTQISREEDAKNWFFRLFALLKEQMEKSSGMSILIRNILDYIRRYAAEGLRLEDVSNQFHISPNYLSTLIRKETGITYQQHILLAKMAVAKQLLDDTRMRVEDIAYSIGYENYISFYNIFKCLEGMAPSEYRFRNRREGS